MRNRLRQHRKGGTRGGEIAGFLNFFNALNQGWKRASDTSQKVAPLRIRELEPPLLRNEIEERVELIVSRSLKHKVQPGVQSTPDLLGTLYLFGTTGSEDYERSIDLAELLGEIHEDTRLVLSRKLLKEKVTIIEHDRFTITKGLRMKLRFIPRSDLITGNESRRFSFLL
jgi:hypothetical protein